MTWFCRGCFTWNPSFLTACGTCGISKAKGWHRPVRGDVKLGRQKMADQSKGRDGPRLRSLCH